LRLLLDEQLSPAVAEALRRRGHDCVAVAERPDLRGRHDDDILRIAAVERRVLVTEDVADFALLAARRLSGGTPHHGIVLVPHRTFPRTRSGIGLLARALERLLTTRADDDALVGQVEWLAPAPRGRD
jgi:predicted nuclease of predicted toxin-antitoxin system